MRGRDQVEVQAQTNQTPLRAMYEALDASPRYARTLFIDLAPLAMFGLAHLSVLGDSAQVWCFGTEHIDAHPVLFMRQSRRLLPELFRHASVLTNLVCEKDIAGQRWLTALGARYVSHPHLRNGRLFGQFILAATAWERAQCRQV